LCRIIGRLDLESTGEDIMGVTIHYQGRLRRADLLDELGARLDAYAVEHEWVVTPIDVDEVELFRAVGGEIVEYRGPARGFVVGAHEDCEPVSFIFDAEWFMQEATKTQLCPTAVHVQIAELLRAVADLFDDFRVMDEGEYWETGTTENLERKKGFLNRAIDSLSKTFPGAEGPVAFPNTRFEEPPDPGVGPRGPGAN